MTLIQVEQVIQSDPSRARLPHDKKYASGIAFANGTFCAVSEATLPLYDQGFLYCDVAYEKVTVTNGRFFRLDDHFDRLSRSCRKFRLRNPYTNEEMVDIFNTLARLSGFKDAGLFWCVTRGLAKPNGGHTDPNAYEGRLYAVMDPYGSIIDSQQRNRGLDIIISKEFIRIHPKAVDPTVKNFHWMDMRLSLFEAGDQGKDWSVLTDADGYLTESPGANIFVVQNGKLYTPESGCLEGITRKTTLELAEMLGVPASMSKIHARQLKEADDAFLTSSAGGIMPINSVDGVVLGGTHGPGEVARRFHNLYWQKLWEGWKCKPIDYHSAAFPAVAQA